MPQFPFLGLVLSRPEWHRHLSSTSYQLQNSYRQHLAHISVFLGAIHYPNHPQNRKVPRAFSPHQTERLKKDSCKNLIVKFHAPK